MNWGMESFLEEVAAPCAKVGRLWAGLPVGGQDGEAVHWFHAGLGWVGGTGIPLGVFS